MVRLRRRERHASIIFAPAAAIADAEPGGQHGRPRTRRRRHRRHRPRHGRVALSHPGPPRGTRHRAGKTVTDVVFSASSHPDTSLTPHCSPALARFQPDAYMRTIVARHLTWWTDAVAGPTGARERLLPQRVRHVHAHAGTQRRDITTLVQSDEGAGVLPICGGPPRAPESGPLRPRPSAPRALPRGWCWRFARS